MSTRAELIAATKDLLWERGFESMSPSAILQRSGAGQGSLYHHFRGKSDLAATALSEISAEMRADVERALSDPDRAPLDNVIAYLTATREATKGCRIGRYANESEVVSNSELLDPIRDYFTFLQESIASALAKAQAAGDFDPQSDVNDVALALVATVQGGYILSRIYGDAAYMDRATQTAAAMLRACAPLKRHNRSKR